MKKTPLVLLAVLLASLTSAADDIAEPLSHRHLDLEKWHRGPDCCTATGTKAALASGGDFSSAAGLESLSKGGNVIDAAVSAALCLAVERPQSTGLGGGGFMLLHLASPARDLFLDFRETAPRKATRDMFLDKKGNVVPGRSVFGALSVAIPGMVAGLYDAHKEFGKLPWKDVVAPCARLARLGFKVYPTLESGIVRRLAIFKKDPYLRKIFLRRDGSPLRSGDLLKQVDLADTLDLIAKDGKAAFYSGAIAKKIVAYMKKEKGLIDARDLRDYEVEARVPLHGSFHDYTFITAPPPAAGGVLLIEMLNVLAGFDLKAISAQPSRYVHLLGEVMKRAYADRSFYIGDPKFAAPAYDHLLTAGYAANLRKGINPEHSTPSKDVSPGTAVRDDHGTAQVSVLDAQGNAVSGTLTINHAFGAAVAVPGTGILLNNQMDDFSAKLGAPNKWGLIGGEANLIAPGKRPLTSSTPTIVFEKGKPVPVLVVGGAGGSRITSSVTQVVLHDLVIEPGDVREAVFAPRAHQQWQPDRLELEDGFDALTKKKLETMGNEIAGWPYVANIEAVGRNRDGGLVAVFDPRDEGGAIAY